jgi:hypothetical protein
VRYYNKVNQVLGGIEMRAALVAFITIVFLASGAFADGQVTLRVSDMPLKDAVAQIEQKSGADIVLDPKAKGSVTIDVSNIDVSRTLDIITKLNNLTWKKLQFARPADSAIKLDELKSAMLALSSLQMVGLSVEDPSTKTTAVYARDLNKSPEMSSLQLPQGYTWATVYVILCPEAASAQDKPVSDIARICNDQTQNTLDMANMTPEQRQQIFASEMNTYMTLSPEARQSLLADRMRAMFNMNSQDSEQFRRDMRSAMRNLRQSGDVPDRGGRNRNRN